MILVLIFAVLSVICGVLLVSAAGFSLPAALLLSVLFFFLLHVLYSLFFWSVACTVPKGKPLEKQNAILRFGAGTIVKVINFYGQVFACLQPPLDVRPPGRDGQPERV